MGLVLLDTTVLIDALRGRPAAERVRSMRQTGDRPVTSVINVEEVTRGLRSDREREQAARLFAGLRVVPLRQWEGERAGTWRREFAARGRTLSQADCLVAAAALSVRARLATGNAKDFPMSDVRVEHWAVGG